ncbi:hypothetical protein ACFSL6_00005, partial [Paenibacillus thailandensis]|uniref:hypothetical protein n=1 Tax=Paenibacillus thailandensis TaxID=393250 RepID=UPI003638E367
ASIGPQERHDFTWNEVPEALLYICVSRRKPNGPYELIANEGDNLYRRFVLTTIPYYYNSGLGQRLGRGISEQSEALVTERLRRYIGRWSSLTAPRSPV